MSEFGYDLAGESVKLFHVHEARVYESIEGINKEIDQLVLEMEDLERFLSLLSQTSNNLEENDHKLELEDEDIERIERLSKNPDLRHIFPPHQFSWQEGEITKVANQLQEKLTEWSNDDSMKRMVSQRIEGPIQRKIGMKSEEVMLEQHELTKATELFNRGVQRMLNLNERIISNMLRAR